MLRIRLVDHYCNGCFQINFHNMRNQPGIVSVKKANIVEMNRQTDEWRQLKMGQTKERKNCRKVALVEAQALV